MQCDVAVITFYTKLVFKENQKKTIMVKNLMQIVWRKSFITA